MTAPTTLLHSLAAALKPGVSVDLFFKSGRHERTKVRRVLADGLIAEGESGAAALVPLAALDFIGMPAS